jgi:hypothetical protein
VISADLFSCDVLPSDDAVRKNPIATLKKNRFDFYRCVFTKDSPLGTCRNRFARRKNPMPSLKKEHWEFYTANFSSLRALIAAENRFGRWKNPSNRGDTRLLPNRRNRRRNGCTVTTNHLLLARQRSKGVFFLPIAQPNLELLGSKGNETRTGGRGGQRDASVEKCHIDDVARKFYSKWGPCPILVLSKKTRFATAAQCRPIAAGTFL